MFNVSREIATYLEVEAGYTIGNGGPGFPIFVNNEPEEPDDVLTIYDSGGSPPDIYTDPNLLTDRSNFQIRIRDTDQNAASQRLDDIAKLYLGNPGNLWINSTTGQVLDTYPSSGSGEWTHYILIAPTGSIIPLPRDKNDRWIFVRNFAVIRENIVY